MLVWAPWPNHHSQCMIRIVMYSIIEFEVWISLRFVGFILRDKTSIESLHLLLLLCLSSKFVGCLVTWTWFGLDFILAFAYIFSRTCFNTTLFFDDYCLRTIYIITWLFCIIFRKCSLIDKILFEILYVGLMPLDTLSSFGGVLWNTVKKWCFSFLSF